MHALRLGLEQTRQVPQGRAKTSSATCMHSSRPPVSVARACRLAAFVMTSESNWSAPPAFRARRPRGSVRPGCPAPAHGTGSPADPAAPAAGGPSSAAPHAGARARAAPLRGGSRPPGPGGAHAAVGCRTQSSAARQAVSESSHCSRLSIHRLSMAP